MARKKKKARRTARRIQKPKIMKERKRELYIFAGIMIIALAILIAITWYVLQPKEETPKAFSASIVITQAGTGERAGVDCLAKYGISGSTVVFVYGPLCTYSRQMEPWVQQLQGKGENFFWASTANGTAMQIVSECLSGVAKLDSTPEFICPANGRSSSGPFTSIDEMSAFVSQCG
jgi:hypothetical protein